MEMPKPPRLTSLLGPSFVLLGLGLGSGELILWPFLASKFGLGIMWAAVVGISFQFVLNMEIERYTLATGESVFVGLKRKWGIVANFWFLISSLLPWVWPGIVISSAMLLVGGGSDLSKWVSSGLLIVVGLILSLGRVVYRTLEFIQKWLVFVSVPIIFVLVLGLSSGGDWMSLIYGLVGKGDGYWFLPEGIPLFTLLGALVYSGAGGNLNLAQSYYVREKGFGMGKFTGRITSIFRGKVEEVKIEGKLFDKNELNLKRFRHWWKLINVEHLIIFWLTGLIAMLMLSLLAYSLLHGKVESQGIQFLWKEAEAIGNNWGGWAGRGFLMLAGMTLLSTQLSVVDAVSRIAAENWLMVVGGSSRKMPRYYFVFLWVMLLFAIVIVNLNLAEPLFLITLGAVLNAVAMIVSCLGVWRLNTTMLHEEIKPSGWRRLVLFLAVMVYLFLGGWAVGRMLGLVV